MRPEEVDEKLSRQMRLVKSIKQTSTSQIFLIGFLKRWVVMLVETVTANAYVR